MADTLIDNTFSTNGAFKAFDGKDISKTPLVEANLVALQNYIDTKNTLLPGMIGVALDTNKLYILNTKGTPPSTPHSWEEFTGGSESRNIVWDGAIPFSTFYADNSIPSLSYAITVILSGYGHTIDNKGSQYVGMHYVVFTSYDDIRVIGIAQDATLDNMPSLLFNVTLESQSTAYICANLTSQVFMGYHCYLQCNSMVINAKFIDQSGAGSSLSLNMYNARINSGNVITLESGGNLSINMYNNSYINPQSVYGSSGNIYLNYDNSSNITYRSNFTNYTGNIFFTFFNDANSLKNNTAVIWDSSVLFSDFYLAQNISTLSNVLTVFLKGTGHTINNKGSIYANMDKISFVSGGIQKTINVAQNVTFNSYPILINGINLRSQSTLGVITNPTSQIKIGTDCVLSIDTGARFVNLTGASSYSCVLNGGSISGSRVLDLAGTSTLTLTLMNKSTLDALSVYGIAGTTLNIAYSADSTVPERAAFVNFLGTINYVQLDSISKIAGGSLQLPTLSDIVNRTLPVFVGQLAVDQSTGNLYRYVTINNPPTTPHVVAQIDSGGGNLSGSLTANKIPVATGTNTLSDSKITQDLTQDTNTTTELKIESPADSNKWLKFLVKAFTNVGRIFTNLTSLEFWVGSIKAATLDAAGNLTVIGNVTAANLSGTNTGDQIIPSHNALSGVGTTGPAEHYGHIPYATLPNGTAAITQPIGSNSIDVATTAYVDRVAPTANEKSALDGANSPTAANPFLTVNDGINSTNALKQTIGQLPGAGNSFYFDTAVIKALSTENEIELKTLTETPSGTTELTLSCYATSVNSPLLLGAFLASVNTNNYYGISAGVSSGKIWTSASDLSGTTEIVQNIMRRTLCNGTVTMTGSGTTRTVTASQSIFFSGDGNADKTLASYLYTPKGIYQISSYTSPTSVTIIVPSTYANETNVTVTRIVYVYKYTSGNILTTTTQEKTFFSDPNSEFTPATSVNWNPVDQVAIFLWAKTTVVSTTRIDLVINGNTRYSHLEIPKLIQIKSISRSIEPSVNYETYRRGRPISGTGNYNFGFTAPEDLKKLLSAHLLGYPSSGAAAPDAVISTSVGFNNNYGEAANLFTASELNIRYDLTNFNTKRFHLPFTNNLSNIRAGAEGGVNVNHISVGGTITYTALQFIYT
jgi:hypothetical protein